MLIELCLLSLAKFGRLGLLLEELQSLGMLVFMMMSRLFSKRKLNRRLMIASGKKVDLSLGFPSVFPPWPGAQPPQLPFAYKHLLSTLCTPSKTRQVHSGLLLLPVFPS